MTGKEMIEIHGLKPHPEGGYYRELFRLASDDGGRDVVSSICYLLPAGQVSAWHRFDALEIWHYHAGAALGLELSDGSSSISRIRLGMDPDAQLQVLVPAGVWQRARSEGDWTLAGCTVVPAFEFAGFELAPDGWCPGAKTQEAGCDSPMADDRSH